MAGSRPSLLNIHELEEARALAIKLDAPMKVYIHYFFYQAALDRHEFDQAEEYLNNYIQEADAIPEGMRGSVWIEAAFFYAFVRKDLTRACEYFNQYKPSALIPLAMVHATQAAIAILKNQLTEAVILIDKALKELPNMMDRGIAHVLNEKLQDMKEQIGH
jgi:tetratricopeptide (TPR) repeat protein